MSIQIEIILDTIEALLLLGVFSIIQNQKDFIIRNKIKSGLFCMLYVMVTYMATFYVTNDIFHTLFLIVYSILLLTLITKINIFSSTVVFSFYFTIIFVTESFVQFFEMFIFKIDINQIFSESKYLFIFLIFCKLFQIFLVAMLFFVDIKLNKLKQLNKKEPLFSSFIMEIGILSLFIFILSFSIFDSLNTKVYIAFIFISYFLFLVLGIKDLKKRGEIISIANKYKVQEYQIKDMEEIISIIRQEKHDYANHINVIQGLCTLNKPNTVERIKDYVSKISDSIHASFRYLDTGNDYFDGLLSIKYNYAIKKGIDFKVLIDEPFSSLKIREDEMISIVSNIIDNAFESEKSNVCTEKKEIVIKTFMENKKFCIEITDNGDGIPSEIKNKVFNKGFSTKVSEKGSHGYGLFITKELVEKNRGSIVLESEPGKTMFLIKFMI